MELIYKGTFRRDYNLINNKELIKALKKKFDEIRFAKNISKITSLKQFKARERIWYKIEVRAEYGNKKYWILCIIRKNIVEFRRVKPESFFKKHF